MDLYKAIQELHAEKERLDQVIASLEELLRSGQSLKDFHFEKRRGRKSMSTTERLAVSLRMKNYWARRRTQNEARQAK
jgi:hypothetical protein